MATASIVNVTNTVHVNSTTIPYSVCTTEADVKIKAIFVPNFKLRIGAVVAAKFDFTNTAESMQLDVSNTGSKPVYYDGKVVSSDYVKAGRVYEFIYNGEHYDIVGDITTDYVSANGGEFAGDIKLHVPEETQKNQPSIQWAEVNNKNPYIGYAKDKTDGTFIVGSTAGTKASDGLSIDGTSGKLTWNGEQVSVLSDIPEIHYGTSATAVSKSASAGSAATVSRSDHVHSLPAASKTAFGGIKVGDNITVSSGTISLTKSNVTDALGYTPVEKDSDTDTGATSVEVTGSGNAVTSASYDATTRKLTLTKGATYNNYSLPTASSSTLGGVKTTSTVTSTAGLTACPIINGVPYYSNTATGDDYTLSSFGITATANEINSLSGIDSNVQDQLDGKRANTAPASGAWFAGTPKVDSNGVTKIGRYLDFHYSNGTTMDRSTRLYCNNNSTTLNDIELPAKTGTLALLSDLDGYAAAGHTHDTYAATSHTHSAYYDSGVTRTKNTVLAAPSDKDGTATFRKLVAADLPSHSHSGYLSSSPAFIEFTGTTSTTGNGGFIDFRYNGSTADHTSRIIESSSGTLTVNGLAVNNSMATLSTSNTTEPCFRVKNSLHDGWLCASSSGRLGLWSESKQSWIIMCDEYGKTCSPNSLYIGMDGTKYIGTTTASLGGTWFEGNLYCNTIGKHTLGTSTYYWKDVYAASGAVNTSDRNKKKDIADIADDQRYIDMFNKLSPVSYKFIDGTSGRTHIGFISQDVEEAMSEVGLTDLDFAGYCRDKRVIEKIVFDKDTGEDVIVKEEVLDENGNPIYDYALRYSEFIALNTKMIQLLQEENKELKSELKEIKEQLAKLV